MYRQLKRPLQQLGPLLLIGIIIWLLGGGFPPANWRYLGQVLIHPSLYKLATGASMSTVLLILWVQALLLALVWTLWAILSIRAIITLLRTPEQAVRTARPVLAAPDPLPVLKKKKPAEPVANPFENLAQHSHRIGTITVGKAAEEKKEQIRQAQLQALRERQAALAAKSAGPQFSGKGSVPPAPAQSLVPSIPAVPTRVPSPQAVPSDPFDVQMDLLDSFDEPQVLTPAGRAEVAHPEALANEFVFGNPFEGPLPEVFEYDRDLKQTVEDMKQSTPVRQNPRPHR